MVSGEILDFATEKVRRPERRAYWRECVWTGLGAFELSAEAGDFEAAARLCRIGSLQLANVRARAHSISRSWGQTRGDDRRLFKIVMQQSGQVRLEQRDRRVMLNPGDWTIYDVTRPFSLSCSHDTQQYAMFVRAEDLRLADLSRYSMHIYPGAGGYSAVLRSAVATAVHDRSGDCPDGDVATMLLRLARLAILEHGSAERRRSSREIMRERIDAYLEAHMRRGDLSIESVADALHCSKRYLHKVFMDSGQTLSEHILSRRLELCREELAGAAGTNLTVTDVAFASGFSSLAYFSRVFKKAYDMSPREYRETVRTRIDEGRNGAAAAA